MAEASAPAAHHGPNGSTMRPSELNPLFAGADALAGVGPRILALLGKALALPPGVETARIIDLLWHSPHGVIDRRAEPTLAEALPGTISTFAVRVVKHRPSPGRNSKAPYRVRCEDESGAIDLVFFHAERKFLERQLPEGATRYISGRVDAYGDSLQMLHPDYILPPESRDQLPLLEPVYGLTAGLSGKVMAKTVRAAAERVPDLPEWQHPEWLRERKWPAFAEAWRRLHMPQAPEDIAPGGPARQRLAYDELLASQLALALVRQSSKSQRGRSVRGDGAVRARILKALPFALTGAQQRALADIEADRHGLLVLRPITVHETSSLAQRRLCGGAQYDAGPIVGRQLVNDRHAGPQESERQGLRFVQDDH